MSAAESDGLAVLVPGLGEVGGLDLRSVLLGAERDAAVFIAVELEDGSLLLEFPNFIEESISAFSEMEVGIEVEALVGTGADGVHQEAPGRSRLPVPDPQDDGVIGKTM